MSALVFGNLDERLSFEEESGKAVERKSLSYLEVLNGQHADPLTKRMDGALQHRRQRYEPGLFRLGFSAQWRCGAQSVL